MIAPLDRPRTPDELEAVVGATITEHGLGGNEAMRVGTRGLGPALLPVDPPPFPSFIPGAANQGGGGFGLAGGGFSLLPRLGPGGLGSGFAQNQALRWLADLAGLPASAGGV